MNTRCVEIERIGEVLDLPADHAERQHLETCPRCRNLARAYSAFLRAESPSGARPEAARAHLAGVIERAAASAGGTAHRARAREPWWRLRTAQLAFAAVAVSMAAAAVWWTQNRHAPESRPTLRSEQMGGSPVLALAPATVAGGIVHLAWEPEPRAESYEVRVFDAGLDEIYRHPPVTDTSLELPLSEIGAVPGTPGLVWRVYALRAGDVVATSRPGAIPLP